MNRWSARVRMASGLVAAPSRRCVVARAYRSGVTWIVEGALERCFDSLPHAVILACVRKRIKDARFIDLIRRWRRPGGWSRGSTSGPLPGRRQGSVFAHLDEYRGARIR